MAFYAICIELSNFRRRCGMILSALFFPRPRDCRRGYERSLPCECRAQRTRPPMPLPLFSAGRVQLSGDARHRRSRIGR
jgi:hypothetical protein